MSRLGKLAGVLLFILFLLVIGDIINTGSYDSSTVQRYANGLGQLGRAFWEGITAFLASIT